MNNMNVEEETSYCLATPVQNTNITKGREYLVRNAGSFLTINGDLMDDALTTLSILSEGRWVERTAYVREMGAGYGSCRYFSSPIPDGVEAFQGAVSLDEYVSLCYRNKIPMDIEINPLPEFGGNAKHQNEIVSANIRPQKVSEMWIIVGHPTDPCEEWTFENAIVYTWHPGRVYSRSETVVKLKVDGLLG